MNEIKQHKELLETIKKFRKLSSGTFISSNPDLDGLDVKFRATKNDFALKFEQSSNSTGKKKLRLGQYYKNTKIQLKNDFYVLENMFINSSSPPVFSASAERIHTSGFSEKRKLYYQLVIPLEREIRFHQKIQLSVFETDLGYSSNCSVVATLGAEQIRAICINFKEQKEFFLIIDSPIKQTFSEFEEKVYAVKTAIGYLTGYYAGDQGFFFAKSSKLKKQNPHFRCVQLRESINSHYFPVTSNAHAYLYRDTRAKKYVPLLRPISLKEFSVLCEKLLNNRDFASTLMLIQESSVASLLLMPGGLAIALESLAQLIVSDKKANLAPIKNKTLSDEIRKKLLAILDTYSEVNHEDNFEVLYNRIKLLNQPTNSSKLSAPFDVLSIKLEKEDLNILKTRNDFLHGRFADPTSAGSMRPTERVNKDLYYVSMSFYTLLSLLILKWIGYDGRVINFPKLNEVYTGIKIAGEPYRQI